MLDGAEVKVLCTFSKDGKVSQPMTNESFFTYSSFPRIGDSPLMCRAKAALTC